eukprot:CAMPEP_0170995088 /NCGR_PEP_ID=MMETSP0736-20130129/11382_1 /TAXON_ID=186038 /ORGANISM="Fragilariopsis kerguelensis, Strain L26-C5" /LENGTH=255 /DNA_ID=CAMNT_0011421173 /DNA_START=188 /DNA_END=951 /DNA_ORIENTATION=-
MNNNNIHLRTGSGSNNAIAAVIIATLAVVATTSSSSDVGATSTDSQFLNVYGGTLQSCSQDGMALTGYTRSGHCVEQSDDAGSHHICIDLSSTGDADGNNFCQVTGQSDWCSYEDMPCHNDGDDDDDDDDGTTCPVTNWCVCQWAFSSYVLASGCDNIQTIVCESINLEAVLAYKKILDQPTWYSNAGSVDTTKYQSALECIVSRCNLDINNLPTGNGSSSSSSSLFTSLLTNNHGKNGGWLSSVLLGLLIAGIA